MPPQRDPYMQPMQESYRIPQWVSDQRLPPPQWPQQQSIIMSSNDGQVALVQPPKSLDITDTAQQVREQQQQPSWPIQPLMPVLPANDHLSVNEQQQQTKHDGTITTKKEKPIESVNNNNGDQSDDDSSSDYEEEEKPTEPPAPPVIKKKQRKHKKQENKEKKEKAKKQHEQHEAAELHDRPVHEQLKIIKTDLDMEFMDHDGAAKRPGGAVLSLTLG